MGTFIWLFIATGIGYFVGDHWFDAAVVGGIIGFVVGLLMRFASGEAFGDVGDSFGGGGFDCGDGGD